MDVIVVMCIGVLIGNRFMKEKYKKLNEKLQIICTVLLIFSMGVMLGGRDHFLEELSTIGVQSLIFCILPIIGSIVCVYLLTRLFMEQKKGGNG